MLYFDSKKNTGKILKTRNFVLIGVWQPWPGFIGHNFERPPVLYDQMSKTFLPPQRSCGKVMFLHLSVSHSVHRGGICHTPRQTPSYLVHVGIHTPRPVHVGMGYTPSPLGGINKRAVRILLECILVMVRSSGPSFKIQSHSSEVYPSVNVLKCLVRRI